MGCDRPKGKGVCFTAIPLSATFSVGPAYISEIPYKEGIAHLDQQEVRKISVIFFGGPIMTRTSMARVLNCTLAVLAFSADVASAETITVRPTLPNIKIQTPNHNQHNQQIQINSFQWGVGRAITQPNGAKSDREGSTPSVNEIVITKPKNKLSPSKLLESATGVHGETP
jgi:hypothetical protein